MAYISHDSTVEKKVLLKNGEVPHVTQLAVATLKPGEQATKHSHKDMTESKLGAMDTWREGSEELPCRNNRARDGKGEKGGKHRACIVCPQKLLF